VTAWCAIPAGGHRRTAGLRIRYIRTASLALADLAARCEGWLDRRERARLRRLRVPADRRDYLAAHALLRATIAGQLGAGPAALEFETDAAGKPRLRGGGCAFSLAHCRGLVCCAVSAGGLNDQIGIDAEPLAAADDLTGAIAWFTSPAERTWLARSAGSPGRRLLELWTAKEAAAKARGTGLAELERNGGPRGWSCMMSAAGTDWTDYIVAEAYRVRCHVIGSDFMLALAVQDGHDWPVPERVARPQEM